ncbi:putative DNA polymerase zeta catalytic subunit [Usnea florida]
MELFRVRLNCVDHYQATPTAFDPQLPAAHGFKQQTAVPKVPVIRVFGATESGQKVCAHIHGALPYLYVGYDGSLVQEDVATHIRQLHLSIDHALAVSYRRNMYEGNSAFVGHITIVKGVPFYGYNVGYSFFLKVYMLNPLYMTRLADLLRQGTILKKVIQPYESHVQYLLQWMCDYNLYGCSYIDCSQIRFRSPVPDYLDINSTTHRWHSRSIPPSLISEVETVPRQSHCSIEIDVCVQHILNRCEVKSRPIHHDFIERTNPIPKDEKLVQSMAGLWRDETRRRKARMGETNPGSSPFPPEVLVSVSADPRNTQVGGWIHEKEYMEKLKSIIHDERQKSDGKGLDFDSFVENQDLENQVKTSLESVEDLFPETLARVMNFRLTSQAAAGRTQEADANVPEVDESRLLSFEEDEFPYESDEELARDMDTSQRKQGERTDSELGHFANQAMHEPMYDNSDRLANGPSTTDATQVPGSTQFAKTQDITSSNELEKMGIRNVGNYDHFDEDTFEVPLEFASDISAERAKNSTKEIKHDRKRRRLPSRDLLAEVDDFDGPTANGSQQHSANSLSKFGERFHIDQSVASLLPETSDGMPHPSEYGERKRKMLPSSQEELKSVAGNRLLSFQVVKDPHDPNTIRKLSQTSSSDGKRSQIPRREPVFFPLSSEPSSSVFKAPRLELTRSSTAQRQMSSQASAYFSKLHQAFDIRPDTKLLLPAYEPPQASEVVLEMRNEKLRSIIYVDAHYSNERDVPERAREYAGKEFKLASGTVPFLAYFDPTGTSPASRGEKPRVVVDKLNEERLSRRRKIACGLRSWEIGEMPPTRHEVMAWIAEQGEKSSTSLNKVTLNKEVPSTRISLSQVDGATQKNRHGFKYSQKQKSTSVQHETQYMSVMGLEIHVNTRGNLVPNPEQDEIGCIFWCLQSDEEDLEVNGVNEGTHVGILALADTEGLARRISQHTGVEVEEERSELELINRMVDIVRNYDPDILTGYEVHGSSWGYLIERARCKYDYNLCDEFSRMKSQSHGRFGKEDDRWGFNHTSTIRVTGRHMINVWRAMRGELNLLQYTMENVVFQLCHRRIPHYSFQDLTLWYKSGIPKDLARVVDYHVSRVQLDLEILEQSELIPRTSEQARLLGVDFFSVFSRGSQFKVESLMFRIAKPENFLLPSPSRKQVGQQNALECLPLVMEPQSAFYNSPMLVLDFQSLYPSVMIAYNYCYSTFLGRVVSWRGQNKMGFTDYHREQRLLELFKGQVNIAPNGIMYAKPDIRKSLLAKMLGEILETRVMIKSGMKLDKDDKTLQRLLNNRQLALKLIANVTYGYTSASFSGRMPCSEIADSIVQTGRETLEKAIALIHSVERWGAEVVYGDTDSLFVYLKGRTKDEAFDIGKEIASTITDMNPRPVKLKFEKVYLPCVLLAKKRYVGFKYESKDQAVPDFDAKGIETVRRDGTPAEQKIEERALKILFRSADLSQVKHYFQRQCMKIMRGKVSIQDFCFAKEVKLGTYSDKGLPPPGALISTRRMLEDPRAEPQYGERVPYVVITGAPGARLIDRCVAPEVLLHNDNNELDAEYYIAKNIIPPLERIFNLVGANVRQWYDEMPKYQRVRRIEAGTSTGGKDSITSKKTLESYMKSSTCIACHEKLEEEMVICAQCMQNADNSLTTLHSRLNRGERKAVDVENVCRSCSNLAWGEEVRCDSKDCPVFYTRTRHIAGLQNLKTIAEPIIGILEELEAGDLDW